METKKLCVIIGVISVIIIAGIVVPTTILLTRKTQTILATITGKQIKRHEFEMFILRVSSVSVILRVMRVSF